MIGCERTVACAVCDAAGGLLGRSAPGVLCQTHEAIRGHCHAAIAHRAVGSHGMADLHAREATVLCGLMLTDPDAAGEQAAAALADLAAIR